jgi:hypothetical protein
MPPKPFGWAVMRQWAREERFRQARTCVLFCALAAEAYVNEFLAAFDLSNNRLKKLDRLPTIRKYTEGTAEAYGATLFRDGDEATPTLRKLFTMRHELVHPKPGLGSPGILAPDDPDLEARFGLMELAEYVVMVAGAADVLTWRAYGYGVTDGPGTALWRGRDAVRNFAARRAELPGPDEPDEPSLWSIVGEHLDGLPALPDHPDATWTRMREARRRRRARR